METIGVDSDIFETKATYIDSSLLEKRHHVVHGDRSELDKSDFFTTFKIIIELIEAYKDLIIDAADKKEYLKGEENGEQLSSTDSAPICQ